MVGCVRVRVSVQVHAGRAEEMVSAVLFQLIRLPLPSFSSQADSMNHRHCSHLALTS